LPSWLISWYFSRWAPAEDTPPPAYAAMPLLPRRHD
jgi:hypothetical protein